MWSSATDDVSVLSYIVIANILYSLMEFGISYRIAESVRSGDVSIQLLRPINYIKTLYVESFSYFISRILTVVVPIIILSSLFFEITIIPNFSNIVSFILSFILGISIIIFIDIIFGLFSFWTTNGWGISVLRQAMIRFLSGALVPIVFFPNVIQKLLLVLPFQNLVNTPTNFLLYNYSVSETCFKLLVQFIWVVVFMFISNILFNYIRRELEINGG